MADEIQKHLEAPVRQSGLAYALRALGRDRLPEKVELIDGEYLLSQTIKHDFFAVTGFYERADGRRAVVKMGRTAPLAGLPLEWIGRWLCGRELRFYQRLADVPNVPAVLGRVGRTGFAHAYVQGRPLSREHPVPDGFFARLQELMVELHRRKMAYVDTNKPQNILLGDDGKPHLIDFQISWEARGFNPFSRWWLGRLQRADVYHILKHKRRMRPDELTEGERKIAEYKSPLIRLHRIVFKPYFVIRRWIMGRLRDSGRLLPEGSK
jgi:hypothetical protein